MKLFILIALMLMGFVIMACDAGVTQVSSYRSGQKDDVTYHGFRTDLRGAWDGQNSIVVIESLEALEAYLAENDTHYNFTQTIPTLEAFVESIDDVFFDDFVIVLVTLIEGSGSIWHELDGIDVTDHTLEVTLNAYIPEIGTTDMAGWHVLIEVARDDYVHDAVELVVNRVQK